MVRKNNEYLRSKHELILDEIKYINKNDSVNLFTRQIYNPKGKDPYGMIYYEGGRII
jgi:hypothetical protein